MRRWFAQASNACWIAFFVVSFFGVPSSASTQQTISEPTDLWFDYAEPVVFKARTYSQNDPQLWLYRASGELVAVNDDYFGLDSWLEVELPAGSYRLRAGRCCGNPDFWAGSSYTLELNTDPVSPTTTTIASTTTTSTTTTTTTTTTVPEVTSTTTTTTEPTPEVTTTWPESTTSTTTSSTTVPTPSVPATTELPTTTELATTSIPTSSPTSEPSLGPTVSSTSTSTSSIAPSTTVTASSPPEITDPVDDTTITTEPEAALPSDANADEIVEYLSDLSVEELASLPTEELEALIEDIANVDLTDEQAEAIAEALSGAPIEVKQAFEAQVDIFSGQFDSYVPAGSNVSVTVRRTIVAVTGLSMLPLTPVSGGAAGGGRRQTR